MNDATFIFVDRRAGRDRRLDADPCSTMPMDLYHRKRRKSKERRDTEKTLSDDYYSYLDQTESQLQSVISPNNNIKN